MDDLIDSLTSLGFTPTESKVYLMLVRDGSGTGYQVARSLGLSRSSVYAALDSLFASGAVFLKDGEVSEYAAKEPRLLIAEKKKAYTDNADSLEESLAEFGQDQSSLSFYNVGSLEALLDKAREMLDMASAEVYMNTDFDLDPLLESMERAAVRGVRILLFSFRDYGDSKLPAELYHRRYTGTEPCDSHRLMLTTDGRTTLVAGGGDGGYRGVFTANPLMARIVSEHIHLDIYIQKAGRSFQKKIDDGELLLGTSHEDRGE